MKIDEESDQTVTIIEVQCDRVWHPNSIYGDRLPAERVRYLQSRWGNTIRAVYMSRTEAISRYRGKDIPLPGFYDDWGGHNGGGQGDRP